MFRFDETGVYPQTQAEIAAELAAAIQDPAVLGPEADVSDASTIGRLLVAIPAAREASVQQSLAGLMLAFDPSAAQGAMLDWIVGLVGIVRNPAQYAQTTSGQVVTTGAVSITPDLVFRNSRTLEEWAPIATTVIGGAGTTAITVRARTPGVRSGLSSDAWVIVTPTANLSTFSLSADLDPDEVGANTESDDSLLARRALALQADGNDWDAIQAAVRLVKGVLSVGGVNNKTNGTVDGVPAGMIETVVVGGDDADIARAIYKRLPPGTETYGGVTQVVEGVTVKFSRPTAVPVWLRVVFDTTGAEYQADPALDDTLAAALLAAAESRMSASGVDVIAPALAEPLWPLTKDAVTGRPTVTNLTLTASTNGSTYTSRITINHRQVADFDSARTEAILLST